MLQLILVMLGGAIGSAARFLTARAMGTFIGLGYPWGTLTVNIVGGFAMGALVGMLARAALPQENIRVFIGVGILGGFTTFSSFSLDTVAMIERGQAPAAALYILVSVAGSVAALFAGLSMMRAVA